MTEMGLDRNMHRTFALSSLFFTQCEIEKSFCFITELKEIIFLLILSVHYSCFSKCPKRKKKKKELICSHNAMIYIYMYFNIILLAEQRRAESSMS